MGDPVIKSSEITPLARFLDRRTMLRGTALLAGGAATGLLYRQLNRTDAVMVETATLPELVPAPPASDPRGFAVAETATSRMSVTNYNNFYEFTTDKEGVALAAAEFVATPWQVTVGGMVHRPRTFDIDDLRRISPPEERIYRMRCVEGWSMVIPWAGFSLARLLEQVEPMGSAGYVSFTSLLDPTRMPGQSGNALPWPYVEGLRMDEAMHPLTLLATGLYAGELPAQNGAPVRLVVPWKYGFKGIKSIVKIDIVSEPPPTTWNMQAPSEYGFFANVNPEVPHPRWSQASEQRIGDSGRRPTLMFNGYAEQVAGLYTGMDLRVDY
ncbi:MAG: protein-methionine-sulfoxide reductase catalytic subunit MsrP [Deltaproteobacteria bacterium]|nr:protein-methionine-sulfoxide reductase catalytic subunit MsrP [Nannocystaceae bacterium]